MSCPGEKGCGTSLTIYLFLPYLAVPQNPLLTSSEVKKSIEHGVSFDWRKDCWGRNLGQQRVEGEDRCHSRDGGRWWLLFLPCWRKNKYREQFWLVTGVLKSFVPLKLSCVFSEYHISQTEGDGMKTAKGALQKQKKSFMKDSLPKALKLMVALVL